MSRKLILYLFFASLASGVNILSQIITRWLCENPFQSLSHGFWNVFFSPLQISEDAFLLILEMGVGTLSGLIFKYFLDKKYVFQHVAENRKAETKTFLVYALMGLATTFIFWGVEWIFNGFGAKYLGAAIGLALGYITKFFLDQTFVFKKRV